MKYLELNELAKQTARQDYQHGWLETHADIFTDEELDEFCRGLNDEIDYDENGFPISELPVYGEDTFD